MCGRYNFSKESSSEMVQAVLENLQSRQIEVKTGEVFPGDGYGQDLAPSQKQLVTVIISLLRKHHSEFLFL